MKVITSEVDAGLSDDNKVLPGVGEFGDRYFGTEIPSMRQVATSERLRTCLIKNPALASTFVTVQIFFLHANDAIVLVQQSFDRSRFRLSFPRRFQLWRFQKLPSAFLIFVFFAHCHLFIVHVRILGPPRLLQRLLLTLLLFQSSVYRLYLRICASRPPSHARRRRRRRDGRSFRTFGKLISALFLAKIAGSGRSSTAFCIATLANASAEPPRFQTVPSPWRARRL